MKAEYKNWVPQYLVAGLAVGTALALGLLIAVGFCGLWVEGSVRVALGVLLAVATVGLAKTLKWSICAYRAFSYDGERQLSRQIVEGTAGYITLPEGGVGLDVGCGSGALTIACAKNNPQGRMVGVDRWGKDYASFSLPLCQSNARGQRKCKISPLKEAMLPSYHFPMRALMRLPVIMSITISVELISRSYCWRACVC